MSRWRQGEADIEQLLTARELQPATGTAADGRPGLARARQTLTSAESLLASDPANAFVLAYDSARQACTALLAHQGLRPTISGGHVAVERAVRAQFGHPFALPGAHCRAHTIKILRRNEDAVPALDLHVVIYQEDDVFVAQCLNVDVSTDGATEDEARANIREALELFFDEPDASMEFHPIGQVHLEQIHLKSA